MIWLRALATVALASVLGAHHAEAAWAGVLPTWTSDQVRASRPFAPSEALIFEVARHGGAGLASGGDKVETVVLTKRFTLVKGDESNTLHDHDLCRAFVWTSATPEFDNTSCYALAAFREAEIVNRRYLKVIVEGIAPKRPMASQQPYWSEAELGVQEAPSDPLAKRSDGDVTEYRLGGDVVVKITGAASPLSAEEAGRFARYLALTTPIHPQIRRDLRERGSLPRRLEIAIMVGDKRSLQSLTISNVRRGLVDYPLPAGLTSRLKQEAAKDDTPMHRGVRQAVLAIDGHSAISRPSEAALVTAIGQSVAADRPMDGLLLFFELSQQYGGLLLSPSGAGTLKDLRPLIQKILTDPQAAQFWDANTLAGDGKAPGDRQAAAKYLSTVRLEGVSFATFRYVTFANLVRESGDTSKWSPAIFAAMPKPLIDNYWTHIAAYPWASNAYNDAGDLYYSGYDVVDAWNAYDLGRAVDPDWRSGVIHNIETLEARLRTSAPDFF